MKYFTIILTAVALVSAQALDSYFPSCSVQCLNDAVKTATPCGLTDGQCICIRANYEAIYNSGTPCVIQACGADTAVGQVLPAAAKYCEDVLGGYSTTSSSVTPSTTSSSVSSSSKVSTSSSQASTTVAPTTTSTGVTAATTTTSRSTNAAGLYRPTGVLVAWLVGALAAL